MARSDLLKRLENGTGKAAHPLDRLAGLEPLPKDADRGAPLAEIRTPDRYLADLILPEPQRAVLRDALEEFRRWDDRSIPGRPYGARGAQARRQLSR